MGHKFTNEESDLAPINVKYSVGIKFCAKFYN